MKPQHCQNSSFKSKSTTLTEPNAINQSSSENISTWSDSSEHWFNIRITCQYNYNAIKQKKKGKRWMKAKWKKGNQNRCRCKKKKIVKHDTPTALSFTFSAGYKYKRRWWYLKRKLEVKWEKCSIVAMQTTGWWRRWPGCGNEKEGDDSACRICCKLNSCFVWPTTITVLLPIFRLAFESRGHLNHSKSSIKRCNAPLFQCRQRCLQ